MSALPKKRFTPAEYAAHELTATCKHEYFDGELFSMAGGTPEHSKIAANCTLEVGSHLRGKPCQVYTSDLMISVEATGLRTYPDMSVICGPMLRDPEVPVAVTNPSVIFEVVSPTTEAYDRGRKSWNYARIPSLQTLVLVSSTRRQIEVRERQTDGSWLLRTYTEAGETVPLPRLGVSLTVEAVYAGVELPELSENEA